MKQTGLISLVLLLLGCETVIEVDLPPAQQLVVVEGALSDIEGLQPIRVTQSNGFSSENPSEVIENAEVIVQSRTGDIFRYAYTSNGYYEALSPYSGVSNQEYRVRLVLDSVEIRSEWERMPEKVSVGALEVDSFEENDPNEPSEQITVFFPKLTTRDPAEATNFYRWIFYKNESIFNDPELLTIQNDRLFNGNLIPNDFRNFNYSIGDSVTVQLISISESSFNYLSLLRAQITTLGTSSGTTPATVNGNLFYENDESRIVLGNFSARAVSEIGTRIE